MNVKNTQIIGVIKENGEIISIKCPLNCKEEDHKKYFGDIKKKWRWNVYGGIMQSFLSEETIEDFEFKRIKIHLEKEYFW